MTNHKSPSNKLTPIPGEVFDFLTVIREEPSHSGETLVRCRCVCGKETVKPYKVLRHYVKAGKRCSCGCRGNPTHKMKGTRPYGIWSGMKNRCLNPRTKDYPRYGGAGVKVCDRWMSFQNFWEDMKDGYRDDLSLDRIDPNGNYEPTNCRWATVQQQATNKKEIILVNGKPLSQIAKETGICYATLVSRYQNGWGSEDIASPITKGALYAKYKDKAAKLGIKMDTIEHRIKRGWPEERLLEPVCRRKKQ